MHELSVVTSLVELAHREADRHGATAIRRICCRIGVLRQVDRMLMEEAFRLATAGTIAAEAVLDLELVGMTLTCRACGEVSQLVTWQFDCPRCGEVDVKLEGGDDIELTSLDLELPDHDRSPQAQCVCQE